MRLRKGPIVGISKRISVPENFTYFAGGAVQPTLPQSQLLFQQRLMQQQQKRAAAVAGAAAPAAMAPAMRHRSGSWSSRHAANKYLQHQVDILIQGGRRRYHVNVCLGASIYDVRKSFGFFNPPPCHCKSSDFVTFVCFFGICLLFGDPLPPPTADVIIYGSPLNLHTCLVSGHSKISGARLLGLGNSTCFLFLLQTCCVGKPYLPTTHDAAAAAAASVVSSATAAVSLPSSEWLFQPIAEDEPGFDEETLEAIIAGATPAAAGAADEVDTTKVCTMCVGLWSEVSGILELGNVLVFVQLIHRPMRPKNQRYKNPNIA